MSDKSAIEQMTTSKSKLNYAVNRKLNESKSSKHSKCLSIQSVVKSQPRLLAYTGNDSHRLKDFEKAVDGSSSGRMV